ncbi:MAG TPA: RNA-binding protein [Acetobacteraceae bacterium]|nr:RNA-binding protein [Acetobacteraceae bacterium]
MPARRRERATTEPVAESEEDAEEPESGPLRRCIVTRQRDDRSRMLRFVVAPDRTLIPDLAARLPGRGIWLSARADVLETACARGAFARAARGPVTVPPDLAAMLQHGLARRVADFLGFARRAGQAVAGFQKAREWLTAGRAGLVVQASDGSAEERARLMREAGREVGAERRMPVIAPLPAATLGAVFGRDHVVHVAVAPGRLAEAILLESDRLAGIAQSAVATTPRQA